MINFLRALCVIFSFAIMMAGSVTSVPASTSVADSHHMLLHRYVKHGKLRDVIRLIHGGADVNEKGDGGLTPLHVAAGTSQSLIVLALINAGANVNAKSNGGVTPLHAAVLYGRIPMMRALINAGANIDAKADNGSTPLHYAAWEGQTQAALVLINAGAYIDETSQDGRTPLHMVAWEGHAAIANILVKAGADIKVTTNQGKTALDIARQRRNGSVVKILEKLLPPKPSGEEEPNVGTAPAPEDSNVAEHVFENAWRSVVYIENNKGQGSGVIIKPNIVATNCHVVDGGGIVVYKSHNRRADKSKGYRATIRRRDEKNDFCLIDVAGLWGVAADVRRYDTLRIGESVYGIGAPKGLDLSLTSGLISQKRTADGVRYIQTDVAISPGSSGGGLFDRKGNLVGILTSKLVDDDIEGIGFAIPADLALSAANQ